MEIAKTLKRLRLETGKTQKEIAYSLGVSVSTVGMYETGERIPPADKIIKLAELYDVSTDYILGRNEVMSSQIENKENHNIDEKIMNLVKERFTDKIADLTEEQQNKVLEYIEFLISKSSKNN